MDPIDTWDCRICRSEGLDREARTCLLERDRAPMLKPYAAVMTREEIVAALDYRGMMDEIHGGDFTGAENGMPVCPVALPPEWAIEVLAAETDASEYGLTEEPSAKLAEGFRIVRATKAETQSKVMEKIRKRGQSS